MDNIQQKHIYSSTEVIEDILSKLGIERETNSTYVEHSLPNGEYLRLRISNHGIYLQRWFDKNKERRMNGENIPKLNIGSNLAITFAPNEQECIAQGETFPMKVRNDTSAKTEFGNNVKPQFTVTHICYNTWELSKEDVELIGNTIQTYVTIGGEFTEPIQDDNKVSIWIDKSNSYPTRLQGKEYSKTNNANQLRNNKTDKNESKNMNRKNTIRLTESDLKKVISESVKKVLKEEYTTDSNIDDFKSRAYGLSENYIRNMHRLLKENEDILPQGLISETHNVIFAVRDFKEKFEYEVQSKAYGIPIDKTRVKY